MTTKTKTTLKELQLKAKQLGVLGYSKLSKSVLERVVGKARKQQSIKVAVSNRPGTSLRNKRTVAIPTTVEEAQQTLARLDKGKARKLRKLLRKRGRADLAAARRGNE